MISYDFENGFIKKKKKKYDCRFRQKRYYFVINRN